MLSFLEEDAAGGVEHAWVLTRWRHNQANTETVEPRDRIEIEHWRAVAARALYECCGECRALLREQLQREETRA